MRQIILGLFAGALTAAMPATAQVAAFGGRAPMPCPTGSATKAALTATLAKAQLICDAEGMTPTQLILLTDVTVRLGKPRRYDPAFDIPLASGPAYGSPSDTRADIDQTKPIVPISGSKTTYICHRLTEHSSLIDNAGKSCFKHPEPQANGICYRTTAGGWHCTMSDRASNIDTDRAYPPPR